MSTQESDWEQVVKAKPRTLFADWEETPFRVQIRRGGWALCAYVGVPTDHPLAGFPYDAIPLDCHWGLTFWEWGVGRILPAGYYWYGWDYGHWGDASVRYTAGDSPNAHRWTVPEVTSEIPSVLAQLRRFRVVERDGKRFVVDPGTEEATP